MNGEIVRFLFSRRLRLCDVCEFLFAIGVLLCSKWKTARTQQQCWKISMCFDVHFSLSLPFSVCFFSIFENCTDKSLWISSSNTKQKIIRTAKWYICMPWIVHTQNVFTYFFSLCYVHDYQLQCDKSVLKRNPKNRQMRINLSIFSCCCCRCYCTAHTHPCNVYLFGEWVFSSSTIRK